MADIITKHRSVFNQSHSLKTTSSFGKVTPLLAEFVTPDTTIRCNSDFYTELKPTTTKLNSTIQSVLNSYYVPMKRVWDFADNFISATGHFKRNGAINEPYYHNMIDKNVDKLPCVNVAEIFGNLLASINSTSGTSDETFYLKTPYGASPNIGEVTYDYIGTDGQLHKHQIGQYDFFSWWIYKLIGNGYSQNQMYNLQPYYSGSQSPSYWRLFVTDPKVLALYNSLQMTNPRGIDPFDASCVCIEWFHDQVTHRNYFSLRATTDNYSDFTTSLSSSKYHFYVKTSAADYAKIVLASSDLFDPQSEPLYSMLNNESDFEVILCAFFNHSNMLGSGSLVEALGCPLFRYKQLTSEDNSVIYHQSNISLDTFVWSCRHLWTVDSNKKIVFKADFIFSALPFFAYQAIISDKYLLPLDVLNGTTPLSGTTARVSPNSAPIDSKYNHNLIIPTKCYEFVEEGLVNLWEGCVDNYGNHTGYFAGNTSEKVIAQRKIAGLTRNQLCSIFFDRSNLIDVDFYTHIWQVPDNNVTRLLGSSDISVPAVNTARAVDAKQMLFTKKLAQFLKRGGFDMSASDYIEKHFGVKDVVEEENGCVCLSSDKQILQTEDVVNSGGAVDSEGNNLALGQKATIASCSKPHRGSFEFYCKQFGFVMQLHHLSVSNEYFNTPNVSFVRLGDNTKDTYDFTYQYSPEFQDTGDEAIKYNDYCLGAIANNPQVAWKCKNFWLKSKQNRVLGDYNDIYRSQILCPTDPLANVNVPYALSYAFLQKTPFDYARYFVEGANADQILLNVAHNLYRKAPMTRENNVGYV